LAGYPRSLTENSGHFGSSTDGNSIQKASQLLAQKELIAPSPEIPQRPNRVKRSLVRRPIHQQESRLFFRARTTSSNRSSLKFGAASRSLRLRAKNCPTRKIASAEVLRFRLRWTSQSPAEIAGCRCIPVQERVEYRARGPRVDRRSEIANAVAPGAFRRPRGNEP
jgi:hypothetical protein